MLLWAGIILILAGIACLAIDRAAAHEIYDHVGGRFWRFLDRTTHLAKASHWLIGALLAYAVAEIATRVGGHRAALDRVIQYCWAFVISLGVGSIVLHSIKLLLGRRRPRDEIEMNLYEFLPLSFNLQNNSFPSGHALTIMCVAVIASAAWPQLALLWFAIALWLGLTRTLLTAHFLSDVLVGAGIGLLSARETVIHVFPPLAPGWF